MHHVARLGANVWGLGLTLQDKGPPCRIPVLGILLALCWEYCCHETQLLGLFPSRLTQNCLTTCFIDMYILSMQPGYGSPYGAAPYGAGYGAPAPAYGGYGGFPGGADPYATQQGSYGAQPDYGAPAAAPAAAAGVWQVSTMEISVLQC